MNEENKQTLKDSALVIADQITSNIPGLNIAWGLSKALFSAGLKLRQQKALEWVEMVRDNPKIFTRGLLEQEEFQDGFVYALERYIREKNENKREIMKNIFLGFTKSNKKEDFEIERMYHVLNILNDADLRLLKNVNVNKKEFHQIFPDLTYQEDENENTYNLISAGILASDYSSRMGPVRAPFIKITRFGADFIDYLKK